MFVSSLFNDDSDYMALNEAVISEWHIEKDEG
jgi:hypothetical protein